MSMPLKWEFPGGKVGEDESLEACLVRELAEELRIVAKIRRPLPATTHQYPSFKITLYPFVCEIARGDLCMHEHAAIRWLSPRDLPALDWAAADIPVFSAYIKTLSETNK